MFCLCVLKYLSDSDETLVSKCAQARGHCKYRPSNSDMVGVVFVSDCWGGGVQGKTSPKVAAMKNDLPRALP